MKFSGIISKFLFGLMIIGFSVTGIFAQKPLGKMVDIGTAKLHLYCTGEGGPTVILDAGAGVWSIHWFEVQK